MVAEDNERLQQLLAEDYCESMRASVSDVYAEWCRSAFQLERDFEFDQIIERAESQSSGLIVLGLHAESQLGR
jgi:hypothetical protein